MSENNYFTVTNNDFQSGLSDGIKHLIESNHFTDVTLVCEDDQIEAHKLVLSTSSDFFKKVLTKNPHPHPLVYLKGVKAEDMKSLLTYMYTGEVAVEKQHLNTFLGTAKDLKINGLVQNSFVSALKLSNENLLSRNSQIQKGFKMKYDNSRMKDNKDESEAKEDITPPTLASSFVNLENLKVANVDNLKNSFVNKQDTSVRQQHLQETSVIQKEPKIKIDTWENYKRSFIVNDYHQNPILKKGKLDKACIPVEKESTFNSMNNDHEDETKEEIIPPFSEFSYINHSNIDTANVSVIKENFTEVNDADKKEIELNERIKKEMENGELTDEFTNEDKIMKLKAILADFSTSIMNGHFVCNICHKETRQVGHAREHIEVWHIKTKLAIFKCQFCGQPLKNSMSLRKHTKMCPSKR